MVVRLLPKQEARVQFPYFAQVSKIFFAGPSSRREFDCVHPKFRFERNEGGFSLPAQFSQERSEGLKNVAS